MTKVINLGQYPFPDAESGKVYPPQVSNTLEEMTGWLKSQIAAGAFKLEEGAEDGGAEKAEAVRVASEPVPTETANIKKK